MIICLKRCRYNIIRADPATVNTHDPQKPSNIRIGYHNHPGLHLLFIQSHLHLVLVSDAVIQTQIDSLPRYPRLFDCHDDPLPQAIGYHLVHQVGLYYCLLHITGHYRSLDLCIYQETIQ